MAASHPDRCRLAALLLLCLPLAASAWAAAPATDIQLDAATSQIDYAANRLSFTDVTISQGDLRVRADRAIANGTGLRFDDSRWEFTGNVRISFGSGTLTAAEASVRFAGNRMAVAQARGTPAQFEQQLASLPRPVRGRAGRIDFDFVAQTLRLSQDAWLFDGRNEMSSPALLYDIREQVARSETRPGSTERVQITIRPEAGDTPVPARPADKR